MQMLAPRKLTAHSRPIPPQATGVEASIASEVLNQFAHGVVLVTRSGRASFINAAASAIIARRDGLALRHDGQPYAASTQEHSALRRMIELAANGNDRGQRFAGCLAISRPSDQRSLVVHVLPLGSAGAGIPDAEACAMLLIIDPERESRPTADTLRRLYGLTGAESTVALGIMRGAGLQAVADDLSVSLSTVRIHLQRVFEKTATRRQAELVRLLHQVQGSVCTVAA